MQLHAPRWTARLATATVVVLLATGCGAGDEGGGATPSTEDAGAEMSAATGTDPAGDAALMLEFLPDLCPLLSAEEASELLGAPASLPDSAANEGRTGSLCQYIADRENRLGFELFTLPLSVWDPDSGTVDELVAITEQTRSSGPPMRVWDGAPGLGGYLAEEDQTTTVWVVTPYGWTPGMSDEATSQVYLRAYVRSPAAASGRLGALADLGRLVIPRLQEG